MPTPPKTPAELIEAGQFTEVVVTDIDWLFDGNIKEALTLRDTDTIKYNTVEGSVDIVLAPRDADDFPEYISYQIAKMIGQRTKQRHMKVAIPDRAWRHPRPTTAASPSGHPLVSPVTSSPVSSTSRGSAARGSQSHPRSPGRPARPPLSPRSTPTYDSRAQEAVHTSGSWRAAGQSTGAGEEA